MSFSISCTKSKRPREMGVQYDTTHIVQQVTEKESEPPKADPYSELKLETARVLLFMALRDNKRQEANKIHFVEEVCKDVENNILYNAKHGLAGIHLDSIIDDIRKSQVLLDEIAKATIRYPESVAYILAV